jgi:hypothetical protein
MDGCHAFQKNAGQESNCKIIPTGAAVAETDRSRGAGFLPQI